MRQRDQQRSRVYAWEKDAGCFRPEDPILRIEKARALTARVWKRHAPQKSVPYPPFLQDGRGVWVRGTASRSRINIPKRMRNDWVVLHEVAHTIIQAACYGLAGHGPEYARVLIFLLARYKGEDEKRLEEKAKKHRVKVASRAAVRRLGIRIPATASRSQNRISRVLLARSMPL